MKWEGRDDSSEQAQWNSTLLDSLVPECYSSLLSSIASAKEPHLHFWPAPAEESGDFKDWTSCMERCQELVVNKPCLTTMTGQVVTPSPDKVEIYGGIGTPEQSSVVISFLRRLDKEVIIDLSNEGDQHVLRVFEEQQMGPKTLADLCRRNIGTVESLEDGDKIVLLKLLADRTGNHLAGLPLLPLRSGLWETFDLEGKVPFFLASPEIVSCIPASFQRIVSFPAELEILAKGWAASKLFGIQVASAKTLASILRIALPQTWFKSLEPVDWDPKDPSQPTRENLSNIWKMLKSPSANIADFKDIPIIPDQPFNQQQQLRDKVTRLSKPDGRWLDCSYAPQKLTGLVQKFSDWHVLLWNPALVLPSLSAFRSQLKASVLLNIFDKNNEKIKGLLEGDRELCTKVIDFVVSDPEFKASAAMRNTMLNLPIFRTLDDQAIELRSTGLATIRYVTKNYQTAIDDSDFLLDAIVRAGFQIVPCRTHGEERLAEIFSLSQMTQRAAQDLLIQVIKSDPENQTASLVWVLENLPEVRWTSELQDVPFLPSDGRLFKMSELFVSTNPDLSVLLKEEQFCFIDQESRLRDFEKKMGGLKTMAGLTQRDIVNLGQAIHQNAEGAINMERLQILLTVAHKRGWMPALSNLNLFPAMPRPEWLPKNLPWAADSEALYPASNLLKSSKAEVGGCVALVSHPKFTHFLEENNLHMKLAPTILLQQLRCLVTRNLPDWDHGLEKLMMELDKASNYPQALRIIEGELTKIGAWVPTQDGFRSVDEVSLSAVDVRNFYPYISAPKEFILRLRSARNLGIKSQMEMADKLSVLTKIRDNFEGIDVKSMDNSWSDEDRVIVNVCNELDENFLKNNTLSLPIVQHGKLQFKDTKDIFWDDVSNEAKKEHFEDIRNEFPIVHLKNISPNLAMKLRLRPVTENLLDMTQLDPSFEEFSQHQTMTNRIKEILREYPVDGPVLFQEQIQNSEDAGASKVIFLLDTNANNGHDSSLLGDTMKACNGESLWIYNDAKFSDDDFQNILNVGGATKKEKTDKIGSFGIGFNSVFHLTDVPSIVSGKHF